MSEQVENKIRYDHIDEFIQDEEEKLIVAQACKNSLRYFIKVMHRFIFSADYTFMPFHDEIISSLEDIVFMRAEKQNLMVNIPVGFGKSLLGEYFIAWTYYRNINNATVYTSYSDKLVTDFSSEIKQIIDSEAFQFLKPCKFKKDKNSKQSWQIEGSINRCKLSAGSLGGTITGLDAGNQAVRDKETNELIYSGAVIIDDPLSASKAVYQTFVDDSIYKYNGVLKSRRRTSKVPFIIFMQRLVEDDLAGYIIENELDDYKIITIKAMEKGKSIWEEKVSTKQLLSLKEKDPETFLSQYQQEPNSNLNSDFSNAGFEDDSTQIFDGVCHIDAGFSGSDYTALTIMKRDGDDIVAYGRIWKEHIDDIKQDLILDIERFRGGVTYIESNADKGYVAKDLARAGVWVSEYNESMNKHKKIMTHLKYSWKNIYWIDETDPNYIKQIQRYNEKADHDDAPDSASSLLREIVDIRSWKDI